MASKYNKEYDKESELSEMLYELLKEKGFNFVSGVPCGVLKNFINKVNKDSDIIHIPAQNEPEAIAVTAGAYLAGKIPAVYMQNSGLLKSTNEISSLLVPCKIPILGIVSYRGCRGETAPQHSINGKITKSAIISLGLFNKEIREYTLEKTLNSACDFMAEKKLPAILLLKRKSMRREKIEVNDDEQRKENSENKVYFDLNYLNNITSKIKDRRSDPEKKLKRENALDAIINSAKSDEAIISTTGLISRSLYDRYDSENQFYNTGSFGMVSSIGLGFSISKPKKRTIVIDGDASLLSNFGSLITIAKQKPKNLTHIVIDNNAYGSCNEEASCSDIANFPLVASVLGYKTSYIVNTEKEIENTINITRDIEGPHLIYINIELGGRRDFKRPLNLEEIAARFRNYFNEV